MRELNLPRTYIFSVDQNRDLNLDKKNTLEVIRYLDKHGAPYKLLEGSYKSVLENTIAVFDPVTEPGKFQHVVENIAADYNQESILRVAENDRKAELLYIKQDREPENLGAFKPVSEKYALEQKSYTFDRSLGQYYVAE